MWKSVESKGQLLEVSADGRVRTIERTTYATRDGKTYPVHHAAKELSPCKGRHGYYEVCHMVAGKRVKHLVHRLVGMAYVPGYSPELTVDHLNGDKADNRVENMEWVSLSENTARQWKTGLVDLRGELAPGSKLTPEKVRAIRRAAKAGACPADLARLADVSYDAVHKILAGERWAHLAD